MKNALFSFIIAMTMLSAHAASNLTPAFDNPLDAARYETLTNEVRCIVCQHQSIADSSAPLANDLRTKIHSLITQQKTDEEIKDYLVKRYGEFILLKPRMNKLTYALWAFPFIALLAAFISIARLAKNYRRMQLTTDSPR